MSSPAAEVRLSRSLATRLFGGGNFQWLLTVVLVLYVALIVFVSVLIGPSTLLGLITVLIPGIPWLFGVTAYARADNDGVHWRYYRPHTYAWSEIDQVEFGSVVRGGASSANRIPAVRVGVAGTSHPIAPSAGVGLPRLTAFARGLDALARTHGVPAGAAVVGNWWAEQQQR